MFQRRTVKLRGCTFWKLFYFHVFCWFTRKNIQSFGEWQVVFSSVRNFFIGVCVVSGFTVTLLHHLDGSEVVDTLPESNSFAPENGWLEYDCFLLGPGLFSGANC